MVWPGRRYLFSAEMIGHILSLMDESAHVDALVALFACTTDIEKVNWAQLLGHETYDTDGTHTHTRI